MAQIKEVNPANLGFKGPLLLTGFFNVALQQHFLTPSGLFDDSLKCFWQPDDTAQAITATKIYIGCTLIPDPQKSNFRPAILIDRGAWKRNKLGMYDNDGLNDKYYGGKIDEWVGSHSFTCLAKKLAEVETLAHEVATFFEVYGQILANQICLNELTLTGISEPKLVMEDSETYSVTVTVHYKHNNRWSLAQMRPKIRHIRPLITVQDYEGKFEPKTTLVDINYDG